MRTSIYDPITKTMKFEVPISHHNRKEITFYNSIQQSITALTDKIEIQAIQSQALQVYFYARNIKQCADEKKFNIVLSQIEHLKDCIKFLEDMLKEAKG